MLFTQKAAVAKLGMLGLALTVTPMTALAGKPWQQINVPNEMTVTLANGEQRDVKPSCSGGPEVTATGLMPANDAFSFFVQRGNPNKIMFFMDGGGACWDALTCIGSPLTGNSTYAQTVDETAEGLAEAGGVLDSDNPNNPFANYTKVFVPYCTGDIHYGSRDTFYQLPTPEGVIPWTIKHRGVDNLQATIHLLNTAVKKNKRKLTVDFARAKDVMVTGVSAGGYGATLAFGYVAEETRKRARLNLVSDSAIGVQTEEFFEDVIFNVDGNSSWGAADGLPTWVPAFENPASFLALASDNVDNFQPLLFQALSDYRPRAKLASITTNLDSVQVGFYGATLGLQGTPEEQFFQAAPLWYTGLQTIVNTTAATPNYRFFIEDGLSHTFLASDEDFYAVGSLGISVRNWIKNMIKPGNRAWDNLDAGPPSLLIP